MVIKSTVKAQIVVRTPGIWVKRLGSSAAWINYVCCDKFKSRRQKNVTIKSNLEKLNPFFKNCLLPWNTVTQLPAVFSIPVLIKQLLFPVIVTSDQSTVLRTQHRSTFLESSLRSPLTGTRQEKLIHILSPFQKVSFPGVFSFALPKKNLRLSCEKKKEKTESISLNYY